MKQQIFAISGGGFSNEENSPLDWYLHFVDEKLVKPFVTSSTTHD